MTLEVLPCVGLWSVIKDFSDHTPWGVLLLASSFLAQGVSEKIKLIANTLLLLNYSTGLKF